MITKSTIEIINDIADLQTQIYDLSDIGTEEVLKSIKESYLLKSKVYFSEVILTIKKSIESRNKLQRDDYYLLIDSLKDDIRKYFSSYELCFNIFCNNEIRLKLLTMDLIDIQDIIFLIKLYPKGSKKKSLIELFSEFIKPHLSEIQSENESDDNNDETNSNEIDPNYRIPFLSNRPVKNDDKDRDIIISLLDAKAPLTKKEKDNLAEMLQKSIINDDIDTFQFLVSSTNTFVNKEISKIDFMNEDHSSKITLVNFSALNGSIKVFKFLIMNDTDIDSETVINAIEGGNYDILHIIELNDKSLFDDNINEKSYIECAISSNQIKILDYLIDNYNYDLYKSENMQNYLAKSIESYNYDIFYRLITHKESIEDYQNEFNTFLKEKLMYDDAKNLESIMKNTIYNGATQMFIVLFQNFTYKIKDKIRHQCMKDSFKYESKSIFEFLLKVDKIQTENEIENKFEYNITAYKDDLNFMKNSEKSHLNFILYLFDLIEENIQTNEKLKICFLCQQNSSNQNIFHLAAKNNWLPIIDFFITKEPNKTDCAIINDYQNNTPLHIASEYHSTAFLKTLISNKEKIYQNSNYVEYFNSANYDGFSPFLLAVDRGFCDIVEFLCNVDEINLNAVDNLNQNALQIAVKNNRNKIFKFLISNINLTNSLPQNAKLSRSIYFLNKDVNGQNLLHIAAYEERLDMIKEIIQLNDIFKPSFLNERDNENHTPLHFAAYSGNKEIIDILLEFVNCDSKDDKLDVDAKGIENETPLHWAAENGFIDVVKLLCEKGKADFNAVDKNEKTPKQRAEMRNHTTVVDYLDQLENKNAKS